MAGYNDDKLILMDKRDHMLINPFTSGGTEHIKEWMVQSAVTGEIAILVSEDSASIFTLNSGGTQAIEFASKAELEQYVKDNAVELGLAEGTEHLTITSGKTASGITVYTIGEKDIASASALAQEIADRTKADSDLKTELQGNIDKVAGSVDKISKDVYESPDGLFPRVGVLEGALDAERKLRDQQKADIDKEFKNVVYWDLPKKESGNTITLQNGDKIVSKTKSGDGVSVIQMTQWDGIQIGSTKNTYVEIDMAAPADGALPRVTVNSGDNKVAYLSDIEKAQSALTTEIDAIEEAVGLDADGKHKKTNGAYTSSATTIAGEIDALDKVVSSITINELTSSEAGPGNMKGYKLTIDGKQHGSTILIPDDSAMDKAWIGRTDDKFNDYDLTGSTITGSTTDEVESGTTGEVSLNLIYKVTDGTYTMVHVNFAALTLKEQFLDGLEMVDLDGEGPGDDYGVKVKIDDGSEKFLTVSLSGVSLNGVQAAIDAAKASATTVVEHAEGNIHVTVSAKTEADGHTVYTVNESDIASASALTQEINRAKDAESGLTTAIEAETSARTDADTALKTELEGKINDEKERAEAAESGLTKSINDEKERAEGKETELDTAIKAEASARTEADTALSGRIDSLSGTTDSLQKELDETQKGAGLSSGGTYEASTGHTYISGATSLMEADKKLNDALKNVEDNAIFGVASGDTYDDCNLKLVKINNHQYIDFTHMIIDCGTF